MRRSPPGPADDIFRRFRVWSDSKRRGGPPVRRFIMVASKTEHDAMTSSIRRLLAAMALAGLGALAALTPAEAQSQIGTLSCDTSGGIGLIITSQQRLDCTYEGIDGRIEGYYGSISKFGIDVGATS